MRSLLFSLPILLFAFSCKKSVEPVPQKEIIPLKTFELKVIDSTQTSVEIEWTSATVIYHDSILYTVYVDNSQIVSLKGKRNYKIEGLIPDRSYEVKIKAQNNNNESLLVTRTINTLKETINVGLIAFYPFTGNMKDSSGNSYDLTGSGVTLSPNRSGKTNSAYYFNSASSMTIPKMPLAHQLDSFTISVWALPANLFFGSPGRDIMYFYPLDPLYTNRTVNSLLLYNNSNTDTRNPGVTIVIQNCTQSGSGSSCSGEQQSRALGDVGNQWIHIVWSKKGKEMFIYINNVKYRHDARSTFLPLNLSNGGKIGANIDPQNFPWYAGNLDDIRIYNRCLSDAEVNKLFTLVP